MATKAWAIILIFIVTILTSVAQILYKLGVNKIDSFSFYSVITNYILIGGLLVYGIAAILMLIAFKGGDVSVLYPIIAASYIFVGLLSIYFFGDAMNMLKWLGVLSILFGVIFINLKPAGGKK
ncbi:MAG: EamA family transporter [Candidatus Woesearchaeota archaeon]|nr:EamA family transporter [Candidatus Woesearchaeota archaeon]